MAELIANCPRCGSKKITFDVKSAHVIDHAYGWQNHYEAFAVCRHCHRATVFVLSESVNGDYEYVHKVGLTKVEKALNGYVDIKGYVSLKDENVVSPPEFIPKEIDAAFREGATCFAVGCYNAAGTIFRLCIDLATRPKLPKDDAEGLTTKVRRDLGLRLPWLFDHGLIHPSLRDLSHCIQEDGNDGAHSGTLSREDAEDLLDFTYVLLERLYTEGKRVELATQRRMERRKKSAPKS